MYIAEVADAEQQEQPIKKSTMGKFISGNYLMPQQASKNLSKFSSWLKTKRGLSRTEQQNVRQLILERERAAMQLVLAPELADLGVVHTSAPVMDASNSHSESFRTTALVHGGKVMNVDCGEYGVSIQDVAKSLESAG